MLRRDWKRIGFTCLLLLPLVSCAKQSRRFDDTPAPAPATSTAARTRININTANKKELAQLPGIGDELAEQIIDHRIKYGPFRKPEHLLMVDGISANRLKELAPLITVE